MTVAVAVACVVVVSVMVENSVIMGETVVIVVVELLVVVASGILLRMQEQPAERTSLAKTLTADLKGTRGVALAMGSRFLTNVGT